MLSWFRWLRTKRDPSPTTPKPDANPPKCAAIPSWPSAATSNGFVLAQAGDAVDYLSTPSVAAYFDARENEAYYQTLKRVGPQRDFHERLVGILERFIQLTDSPLGAAAVDRVIAESLRIERSTSEAPGGSPLEVARARYPKGIGLLGLAEPLTFESLRSAYRSAARYNHPDAGGSHDAMVAVNEAFRFAHLLLHEHEIGAGPGEMDRPVTVGAPEICDCADYRYKCGKWLFLIALDDWNVDGAFMWLERITSSQWQQSSYAKHPWHWMDLTAPAGKVAVRLSLAGLHEQASRALDVARGGLQEAQKHGLSYEPFVREPEDVLASRRRAQVVVNHQRQADNALRLGVIDAKRYQETLERLARSAAAEEMNEERLRQFLAGGGFLPDLPIDYVARGKTPKSQLVPEPGYYVTRITQLADDQQGEYLIAFSDRATLSLVRKYTFVRLMSLLESVVFYAGRVDDAAAEREIRLLASLHDGSGGFYGSEVARVVADLRKQPLPERQAKAKLLRDIERRGGGAAAGAGVTLTIGGESPLGMPLSPDYFKVIRLPIDELRTMRRTGRAPESEEH